ncbi:MAG TPA: hypothetical protein VE988_28470 [Gemmataceae bacterium]|nr:hypothetical protein [Gemmataceae bacterium]
MQKLLLAATAACWGILGICHAQQSVGTPNEPFGVPVGPQKAAPGQFALPTTPGYQKLPTAPQPGAEFLGTQPNYAGNSFVQPGAMAEKNSPIWDYLRQNFDTPDPNQDIAIQPNAGNWVMCIQSYSGKDAAKMARDLVIELRGNAAYKLNAFTYRQGVDECKAEQQRIKDEVARKQAEFAKNNLPLDTPLRIAFTRYEIQYAVLIAGYKDKESAKIAMDDLRKKKLPDLDPNKVQLDMKYGVEYDKSGAPTKAAAVAINPLAQAWVCPNPSKRADRSTGPSAEDMALMKKLNAQEPYSLLKCPKKITLAVREFAMPSELRTDKTTTMSFLEKIGLTSAPATYDTAAISAQNLADLLRKGNFEAYVLHTKYSSYVTVGSYDSEQDPRIERDRKNLAEINGQLNPAARLAAQPRLMAVPR